MALVHLSGYPAPASAVAEGAGAGPAAGPAAWAGAGAGAGLAFAAVVKDAAADAAAVGSNYPKSMLAVGLWMPPSAGRATPRRPPAGRAHCP